MKNPTTDSSGIPTQDVELDTTTQDVNANNTTQDVKSNNTTQDVDLENTSQDSNIGTKNQDSEDRLRFIPMFAAGVVGNYSGDAFLIVGPPAQIESPYGSA